VRVAQSPLRLRPELRQTLRLNLAAKDPDYQASPHT
jgi:hypothetical protein